MNATYDSQQLLERNTLPLAKQLEKAKQHKRVLPLYRVSPGFQPNETPDHFVKRVRDEAKETQFVAVPFEGQTFYVAFGVPGPIITQYGKFLLVPATVVGGVWGTHYFLFYPDLEHVKAQRTVLVKISSGCYSGMVLGDTTCDCKQQLDEAEKICVENTSGVIVEIPRQDGRGWGEYKMANQQLMDDLGMTTIQAGQAFYGEDRLIDQRTYKECAIILRAFGFGQEHTLDLATSNPSKVEAFTALGFQVQNTRAILPSNITAAARRNRQSKLEKWKKVSTQ